ncbi:isoamylase [Arsenicicoccus piscis]|uniref:Glycogen operon protein GlgX homolog n=1 Tax=Arsenicicoccus piscis TaxID=673954 RepID=A0ABQ6HV25_9MICO|nr:isoamylase [Arsenicicoccus piscis]GMA21827.1 glycogen operon protein GlgX homolog [Arsenicicoccus piscis]
MTVLLPQPVAPGTWATATWPLGPSLDQRAGRATFAVFAPDATRVTLEIWTRATGGNRVAEIVLVQNAADGCWRGEVVNVGPGVHYGFRCWGPNWPFVADWQPGGSSAGFGTDVDDAGHRFNPNKLLFDPYGRELSHTPPSPLLAVDGHDDGMFGTGGEDYDGRPRREFDTGPWAPKSLLIDGSGSTGTRPRLPAESTAVYEAHVKNLTLHPSSSSLAEIFSGTPGFEQVRSVPESLRGTYAGAALMAPYLKALGFTTIELMPVHETSSSELELSQGKANHWGYQSLSFFAPNRDYAHDRSPGGPTAELKAMVKAFHDQGLEVYLDVVYNHTAEGGNWGGDLATTGFTSLGGFSTNDYYVQTADHRLVDGATGCSNQLNHSRPASQRLVLDSLTYWADSMGIDGFRFDLAPVLGRTPDAFQRDDWDEQKRFFPQHPLLTAIRELAEARDLEVVAEAWDLWGYEVGNFPSGWGEWNGRFRDTMRGFLKGDGNTEAFVEMFDGDYHDFNDQGGPQRSINFVTAHDGFTMTDLVSYNHKVNDQPPPFGPSDGGSDDNLSWDSGGDQALRRQRVRNFWTVLFLSRGVPMVVSGDEMGRTQNGNNNPWALNTVGMWNNWAMATSNHPDALPVDPERPAIRYHDNLGAATTPDGVNPVFVLATYLARLRQQQPGLRQHSYGNQELDDSDVTYLFTTPDGAGRPNPGDRAVRVHIDGSPAGGSDLLVLINMADVEVPFAVPAAASGKTWRRIVDTSARAEPVACCWQPAAAGQVIDRADVPAWSITVLLET